MPTFELEMNGKSYEVDAPSIDAFKQAYQGGGAPQSDFLHPVKPPAGSGMSGVLERLGQYPRIALGQIMDAGHTLGRVASGDLDAADPEAIGAAQTAVQVANPTSPAYRTGAQIARRAFSPGTENPAFNPVADPAITGVRSASVLGRQPFAPANAPLPESGLNPGMAAAKTATEIGAPLPAGIVSQSPGTQAFTQGFRQVPFVGPAITHKVGQTVKAAGEKAEDISNELSGGFTADKPTVGETTRNALQNVIEGNNDTIHSLYDDLRSNHIKSNMFTSVQNTKAALNDIGAKRWTAGEDRTTGLSDIERLISSGKPFDGLIRARNKIGTDVGANKANPNPGFPAADLKKLYAAISRDMENAVQAPANLRPGINAADAMTAFRTANDTAKVLIERNANIQRLLNNTSNEGMLSNIIGKAKGASADTRLLGELRSQLPKEDWNKIVGILTHELGASEQGFSLNKFSRAWKEQLSPTAKSVLYSDPAHRKALDDIANLGSFLKDADKYRNTSNTAHGAGVAGAIVGLGHILSQASAGEWHAVLAELAGLAGGYGISRIIGRPITASSLRRWLEVARDKQIGRWGNVNSAKGTAAMSIATRNLVNNIQDAKDYFNGPSGAGEATPPQRNPIHVTVSKKIQDRAPTAH